MRGAALGVGLAGIAAGALLLVLTVDATNPRVTPAVAVLNALIVWSFVASGIVAWIGRPHNRIGLLMVGAGASWFLSALQGADQSVLFTIGVAASVLPLGFLVHLVLAFPEGFLRSRPERVTVWVAYVLASLLQVAGVLLWEPEPELPENVFLISPSSAADRLFQAVNVVGLVVAIAVVVILTRRWRTATAPARRAMAPVVWTGGLAAVCAIVLFAAGAARAEEIVTEARLATYSALVLVPIAFLVGLLHSRLARTAVSRLVLELSGTAAPGRLREALARALGDPSLQLAYWLPEEESYVDATGRPFELPGQGEGRAVMHVERDGRRIGALVHDASLADQRELLDSVSAAAALALENERLQAQLRARVDDLRSSEGRLRALIEASPLAIVEVDAAGLVTFWNQAAEDLYGWTAEEAIGEEISFIPVEREGETDELRARLLAGERISGVETLRLRKDGSLVEVVVAAAPVPDLEGDVRFMAVSADISERKRAEEALRHERDFISTLIDSTSCLVVVLDREGRLVRFNRACEQLTGYSAEEILSRPLWDSVIDPAEAESIRLALDRVWAGDFPAENENHWILRDGTRRLIAWSNTALLDDDGEVELIVSSGVDITERKRAEEELRASEARFREMANAAPVMIWMADETGTITFFNNRWNEFTGKPVDELDASWWMSVHPEDRDASVEIWRETIAAGQVYEHEYRLLRGGRRVPLGLRSRHPALRRRRGARRLHRDHHRHHGAQGVGGRAASVAVAHRRGPGCRAAPARAQPPRRRPAASRGAGARPPPGAGQGAQGSRGNGEHARGGRRRARPGDHRAPRARARNPPRHPQRPRPARGARGAGRPLAHSGRRRGRARRTAAAADRGGRLLRRLRGTRERGEVRGGEPRPRQRLTGERPCPGRGGGRRARRSRPSRGLGPARARRPRRGARRLARGGERPGRGNADPGGDP